MKNEENTFQDLSFKVQAPTEKKGTFSLFGLGDLVKIHTAIRLDLVKKNQVFSDLIWASLVFP